LPKRATTLGLFLWHILGMEKKGKALKVRPKRVKKVFGLSTKSVYRALYDLENAGLISCVRKRGRCAQVHIIMVEREGERECL
jgi:transcription initiation factor IIE alpha subunit